jgi:hypothetical protein
MSCHFRSEENDGDEDEEIYEKVNKIRYERHIIMERHFSEACFVFYEAVDVLRDVEHHDDENQQTDREEKRSDIFLEYVPV